LASYYVVDQEFPALLTRAASRKTLLLPILVRPTLWTAIPELAQFQFFNDVRKPLSDAERRDEEFAKIAQKIPEPVVASHE
jgi:hypothetical protein